MAGERGGAGAMIILAILLAAAQSTAVNPVDPDYDRLSPDQVLALDCEQVAGGGDRFVAGCYYQQQLIWSERVAHEYAAALARVDADMKPRLRQAQTAWKRYAEAECHIWDIRGTAAIRRRSLCDLGMTRARVEELRSLDGLTG